MGKCINHPETETSFQCVKYNEYMCELCMKCKDPELYCKFREGCLISYIEKTEK